MRKRFIVPAAIALAALVSLGGCLLQAGYAYGKIDWENGYTLYVNSDFYTTSGFPNPVNKAQYYQLSGGSYYFNYYLGTVGINPPYYYHVSYSVEPNYGPVDAQVSDSFVDIYCYATGSSTVQNWSRGILSEVKPDGIPVTTTKGAYKITVSVKQVELSDTEKASFISLGK